jgi:hypothetical protein
MAVVVEGLGVLGVEVGRVGVDEVLGAERTDPRRAATRRAVVERAG